MFRNNAGHDVTRRRLVITAVVFDIGTVSAASDFAGNAGLGELTEAEVRAHWQARLGLSGEQADELMADYWRWYAGTLDRPLVEWFARVRGRGLMAGILSNSGPGARE